MRISTLHTICSVVVLLALSCSQSQFASTPVAKGAAVNGGHLGVTGSDSTTQTADGSSSSTAAGGNGSAAGTTDGSGTLPGDGGAVASPTPTAALPAVDGQLPSTITISQMVMYADEGSKIALDLTTGLWGDLNVFNFHQDGTRCQDYMGFVGTMQIATVDGSILSQKVDTTWRHWQGGKCSTGTQAPVFNSARQMPGHWGPDVKLGTVTVKVTNSDNGNSMKVTQEGNLLVFTGYHSTVFDASISFGAK